MNKQEPIRVIVYGKLSGTLITTGLQQSEVKLDAGWYQHFNNLDIKPLVKRIRTCQTKL